MGRQQGKDGFTVVELIVVMAVLATVLAVAVPRLSGFRDRADLRVLEANQKILSDALSLAREMEGLPTIDSGTVYENRDALQTIIGQALHSITNPVQASNRLITTAQTGGSESAAVVVAQRKISMQAAREGDNIWPLNSSSEAVKQRFEGVLVMQICEDGYLLYAYPAYDEIHNLQQIPYQE